jgi:hypothetical protein
LSDPRRFVISPLATLRWRQGQLLLTSPTAPVALTLPSEVLPFLDALSVPRTKHGLEDVECALPASQRTHLLDQLVAAEIVEVVEAPERPTEACWWDPHDRARVDARVIQLAQIAHGLGRSSRERLAVDGHGAPVPWLSRPVVDYLDQLDLRGLSVFEFGGGASTSWWVSRGASVTTVESNRRWFERLTQTWGDVAQLILEEDPERFAAVIERTDGAYDIILIDAHPRFRPGCADPAVRRLAARGMIILDDAPFYPSDAARLRRAGLLEVDLTGYCALEDNLQTTSLFLQPTFDLPRHDGPSPRFPFGSPGFSWKTWDQ